MLRERPQGLLSASPYVPVLLGGGDHQASDNGVVFSDWGRDRVSQPLGQFGVGYAACGDHNVSALDGQSRRASLCEGHSPQLLVEQTLSAISGHQQQMSRDYPSRPAAAGPRHRRATVWPRP